MTVDYLIKNGRIVDPSQGLDKTGTIAVKNGRILDYQDDMTGITEVNAEGCIVSPGVIDFHCHISDKRTDSGVDPDLACIPFGVTAAVDQGSTGVTTCRSFLDELSLKHIKGKMFLHVGPTGQITHQFPEPVLPDTWVMDKFQMAFDYGKDRILGLKLRVSKEVVKDQGIKPLVKAIEVAEHFNVPVCIHVTDPPVCMSEIAKLLRPGDIFCHMYTNSKGVSIIEDGKIPDEIWAARERGVIFDACHGKMNHNFDVAEKAAAEGFLPDVITTDVTFKTWCKPPVYGMTHVMSKFLMLGMSEYDIIERVTKNPAKLMHMEDQIGTLKAGTCADITILKVVDKEVTFLDAQNNTRTGKRIFVPLATIIDGQMMYRSYELGD